MSFVGGGPDCAVGNNAVSQLNKHTQQDRSLQQQASSSQQHGINLPNQGFKSRDNIINARDRQNLDQFMNAGSPSVQANSFQFQQMRHELNGMQHHQQPQQHQNNWSKDFKQQSVSPVPQNASPIVKNTQWANEFQSVGPSVQQSSQAIHQHHPQALGNQNYTSYRPMMNSYRPMMMMGGAGGMSSYQQQQQQQPMMHQHQQPQADTQKQDSTQQVDWDDQFKQIEELSTSELNKEEEATKQADDKDDIVIDDKYQATFQEVWDSLNSEAFENDLIEQQYEEFKHTQRETFPADMNQWERDFAKYASTRAHFGDYKFEEQSQNQFMDLPADQDPYEIGLQLMENGAKLSEAALAFEAAIQKNENHVDAWLKLGEVQTQNEKEIAGISALEKCLELHPENAEAMMNLAISYINEGYDNAAFATLERWISTKYPAIAEKARLENPEITDEDRISLNNRVTELFLKAAQLSPDHASMDADVQMGLGVLFYANEDFDKTIDCFKAALSIRPNDAVLWNRLGASLANSNRSEEAVEAYFKALQLKPTFVRARYNLGVSCINIGCYKEAVEHLLSGLSMHQVEGVEGDNNASGNMGTLNHNQSTSLTETLKRAFIGMERRDLVELVKPNMDLNQFRGEFNF
ncbi:Peroxisomal membrane signal receptor PTS1 [Lodderomyces elongisporus]|uniref:Peroxisomal membrane signal receptor PTS1 n=1 Tax=Lodderomyces elongisporus TaxID=36914 RepID=UPI0029240725|nr:Peroxisomal membrane signal receptor PTS1 [Lodderomyces elongisporus]WLF80275.1 Peroxisomal membrane signal receptor PTS1 [Lodderomyces elongisporus]